MTENVPTTRDDLVARLRRAGELEVSGDDQAHLLNIFRSDDQSRLVEEWVRTA